MPLVFPSFTLTHLFLPPPQRGAAWSVCTESVTREAVSVSLAGRGRGATNALVTLAVTFTGSATTEPVCVFRAGTDDTVPYVSTRLPLVRTRIRVESQIQRWVPGQGVGKRIVVVIQLDLRFVELDLVLRVQDAEMRAKAIMLKGCSTRST